jgi:sulfate permease, SulP family
MGTTDTLERKTARWPLSRLDVAGAFGDIGVLFPIAIALITLNHLNPTAVFFAAGASYVLAGRYFKIPIAVQPFKAVAAIALALSLPPSAIASAGLLMGVLLLLIAVTNAATQLARLFSLPIVRGIQLGLGLLLAREGVRLILTAPSTVELPGGTPISAWEIAAGGAVILLLLRSSRRFPAALALLGAGIILGLLGRHESVSSPALGPLPITFFHPHWGELESVVLVLVVPQFALTFGNSIVATEDTARILYGDQARRVTVRALSFSVGIINVLTAFLQGAPLCHGSGGITAHNKFGARSPKSSYVIGGICLVLALFGRAAIGILSVIPTAVLAVFLAYVGIQHAAYVRDIFREPPKLFVAVSVGLVSLATTNLMWGFLTGFVLEGILLVALKKKEAEPLN